MTIFIIIQAFFHAYAQQTSISGEIIDASNNEALAGVNVVIQGLVKGTISDADGKFELIVNQAPPMTIVFSYVGYASAELDITQADNTGLQISLQEQTILGQEVVVSASRMQESILSSPVTIEKVDLLTIQQTAAPMSGLYNWLMGWIFLHHFSISRPAISWG
jgi:hypothetical protein